MKNKKPYIYKRVIAFIIDTLIVTIISGLLTIMLTNNEKYNEDNKKLLELTEKIVSEKQDQDKYMKEFNELNYNLTKDSIGVTIITIGVSIVYYTIMCYFCNGITLGKYILKLKITSANDKELNIFNYFLRSLIINSVLSNIVTIVLVNTLSKESYINISGRVGNVFTILMVVSFIMMMYRDDGRGLHDIIGNTKVISTKDLEEKEEDKEEPKEIEEATIVEEKKQTKKKGEVKNERVNRTRNSKKK